MISVSFARKASDIMQCKEILGEEGLGIKIIAKIENQEGLQNYHTILDVVDGIMIARGDLGMEIPPQKVFVAQKWMTTRAREKGVPIITATQMMESMITNPRPTRAEASDVANAVLDGTDCVMLSGETANGLYPVGAVEIMAKICSEAENCVDHKANIIKALESLKPGCGEIEALAASAVHMSLKIKSPLIIVFSDKGRSANMIAKFRPEAAILALTYYYLNEAQTIRFSTTFSGLEELTRCS